MTIAKEYSNVHQSEHFPQKMKPAYALASALAKEDEQGKEELAKQPNYYQELRALFLSSEKAIFC